jgi:flagellar assembly protein FliH
LSDLLRDARLEGERWIDELSRGARESGIRVSEPALEASRMVGFTEGLAAGTKKGRQEALEELDHALRALESAARRIQEERAQLMKGAEEEVLHVALEVAEKIVHRRVKEDEDVAVTSVRQGVRRAVERAHVTIRVHPEDLSAVQAHRTEWLELMGGAGVLEVLPDRRVAKGGAEIATPSGLIDARIETQLEEASRLARDVRAEPAGDSTLAEPEFRNGKSDAEPDET